MSKYNIEITEPAEKDLYEISRYIAREIMEPAIAKNVVGRRIGDAILTLEKFPQRNALVNDERLALSGIRKIMVDNYIVFYVISEEENTVTVIRILYARRDWIKLI